MIELINNFVINNVDFFAESMTLLFLIVLGTPLISFKGGIPRIAGEIINKPKSLVIMVVIGLVSWKVIFPLTNILFKLLIETFVDYKISIAITLSGFALW